MAATYRIVLADDHVLVRGALRMLLAERGDLDVIAEACDGLELLDLLRSEPEPDAVIVDISMPRLSGIDAIREIRKNSSRVKVLILTMHKDEDLLQKAFSAGADGYLLKEELANELYVALDAIMEAKIYVSPVLAREVKGSWLKTYLETKGNPVCDKPISDDRRQS